MKEYVVTAVGHGAFAIEKSLATDSLAEAFDTYHAFKAEGGWDYVNVVATENNRTIADTRINEIMASLLED